VWGRGLLLKYSLCFLEPEACSNIISCQKTKRISIKYFVSQNSFHNLIKFARDRKKNFFATFAYLPVIWNTLSCLATDSPPQHDFTKTNIMLNSNANSYDSNILNAK
jgi:hypothetical protein